VIDARAFVVYILSVRWPLYKTTLDDCFRIDKLIGVRAVPVRALIKWLSASRSRTS
jgi:hypothetical protein